MLFTDAEIQECLDFKGIRHFYVESRFWNEENYFSRHTLYLHSLLEF